MKKINLLFAACIFLCVLTGCGRNVPANADILDTTPTPAPAESIAVTETVPPEEEEFSVESNYTITRKTRENPVPMGTDDTWTIFIYICGTDLETKDGLASFNLQLLMNGPEAQNVRYIVQTGGTAQWGNVDDQLLEYFELEEIATRNLIDSQKLQRWEVTDTMTLLDEQELAPMSDPGTLGDFLTWGVENYPAEKMGVILWDHGGGSIRGMFADELYEGQGMPLLELEDAFDRTYDSMTDKFEFVAFDACLMGSVEVANVLAPYARYMYASEEVEPGFGWGDYSLFTYAIDADPEMNGGDLGILLCNEFFEFYREIDMEKNVTLSVIDLEKIDNVLYALNNMAIEISDGSVSPTYFAEVSRGVARTQHYAYQHMVDLSDLAKKLADLAPDSYEDVQQAVEEAVVYQVSGKSRAFTNGLSVFYPTNEVTLFSLTEYGLTSAAPDYTHYISDFLFKKSKHTRLNRQFVQITQEPYATDDGIYEMSFDPSTYDYIQRFGFQLHYDIGEGQCIILGFDDDVEFDADTGVVKDNFEGKWAAIDGLPLLLWLQESNPEYNLYHSPILLNGEETYLVIQWIWNEAEPDNGHYEILSTWSGADPNTGLASRETGNLMAGDRISPRYVILQTENVVSEELIEDTSDFIDDDGNYIYSDIDNYIIFNENTMLEQTLLWPGEYYYQFVIVDVFGGLQTYAPITFTIDEEGIPVLKTAA